MVTQLEPASYMAHKQACYTFFFFFQPHVSQQRIRKFQVAFSHNLARYRFHLWVSSSLARLLLNVESQGNPQRYGRRVVEPLGSEIPHLR